MPQNPLAGPLQLVSHGGPKPTDRTQQMLYKYDLHRTQSHDPEAVLARLEKEIAQEPSDEKMYAYAELAYIQGTKSQGKGNAPRAFELYSAAVAHAYLYLFAPHMDQIAELLRSAIPAGLRRIQQRAGGYAADRQQTRPVAVGADVHDDLRRPAARCSHRAEGPLACG